MARKQPDVVRTLPEVVATGDVRASLEATRNHLASMLEVCEPREAAALARELRQVIGALTSLSAVGGGSVLDELRARREGRVADPPNRGVAGK